MHHPSTKTTCILTEIIAVRLALDECRALRSLLDASGEEVARQDSLRRQS
jgi:hypothetical protein